eukprot:scaffold217901_cov26-Tisochrysis_lutea.AAC.1
MHSLLLLPAASNKRPIDALVNTWNNALTNASACSKQQDITEGSAGKVIMAMHQVTNNNVAIKFYRDRSMSYREVVGRGANKQGSASCSNPSAKFRILSHRSNTEHGRQQALQVHVINMAFKSRKGHHGCALRHECHGCHQVYAGAVSLHHGYAPKVTNDMFATKLMRDTSAAMLQELMPAHRFIATIPRDMNPAEVVFEDTDNRVPGAILRGCSSIPSSAMTGNHLQASFLCSVRPKDFPGCQSGATIYTQLG